ncbi:MAG: hypothetical protein RI947_281 [Candidatus Parcubacteria bacterium]|jgi:hydroxymethylglutaryl-CoA reductase (NADPH)
MQLRNLTTAAERRAFLIEKHHARLDQVSKALVDDESKIHCENLIGAISLPVGVAGPLIAVGDLVNGEFYLPLATTEGALVASVNRGCKATHDSGGVRVLASKAGTTRGPVFYTGSLAESKRLKDWISSHLPEITSKAHETSRHLTLKDITIKPLADYVFMRIAFDTQDAMGMNMVTIATQVIVQFIEVETGISCLSVAGNFDIDKKPAWLNFINNRGFTLWAEATIPAEVVKSVLKTSAHDIFEVWLGKCMLGSAMSGSLGYNAHFANIIAALFASTGQDLAHVVEGSMGVTTARVTDNNSLYFSVYLPAVMIGTVGGGTQLSTQREIQELIGVKTSSELAEITAGAVLAGELSLLASLAQGTLATAHKKLGR